MTSTFRRGLKELFGKKKSVDIVIEDQFVSPHLSEGSSSGTGDNIEPDQSLNHSEQVSRASRDGPTALVVAICPSPRFPIMHPRPRQGSLERHDDDIFKAPRQRQDILRPRLRIATIGSFVTKIKEVEIKSSDRVIRKSSRAN
jgi:hypothetical protein